MEAFRFKKWNVYGEAKRLFEYVVSIVNKLPKEYRYSIGDQMIRSGLSVVLNIAEGSGKGSDRELNRYFNIAVGSIDETLAVADVVHDLGFVTSDELGEIMKRCESVSKQLGGFKKQLNKRITNNT